MGVSRIMRRMAVTYGPTLIGIGTRLLRRPVFVVGFNKSGKSLIVQGLAQQRDLTLFPGEGNDVLWFRGFYPWADAGRVGSPLWHDPETYIRAVLASRGDNFREARAQLGLFQFLRAPRRAILNESGMLAALLPSIVPGFPDAKIVHIVRDGRVVSILAARKCLARIRQEPDRYQAAGCPLTFAGILEAQARYWCWTLDRVGSVEEANPESVMAVRYEDWCEDPCAVTVEICTFVGLRGPFTRPAFDGPIKNQNQEVLDSISTYELSTLQQAQSRHLCRMGYSG